MWILGGAALAAIACSDAGGSADPTPFPAAGTGGTGSPVAAAGTGGGQSLAQGGTGGHGEDNLVNAPGDFIVDEEQQPPPEPVSAFP